MPWADIVPIVNEGMSVFTALFFCFLSVGAYAILKRTGEKFSEQDLRFQNHDEFVAGFKDDLNQLAITMTEMQGTIQQTQMVVGRIETSVNKM